MHLRVWNLLCSAGQLIVACLLYQEVRQANNLLYLDRSVLYCDQVPTSTVLASYCIASYDPKEASLTLHNGLPWVFLQVIAAAGSSTCIMLAFQGGEVALFQPQGRLIMLPFTVEEGVATVHVAEEMKCMWVTRTGVIQVFDLAQVSELLPFVCGPPCFKFHVSFLVHLVGKDCRWMLSYAGNSGCEIPAWLWYTTWAA